MQPVAELAGFFAAHAIWCVSDDGPLTPMLAFERPDGTRELSGFEADQLEVGAERGREWLRINPEEAARAVLIVDAFVTLEDGKTDALIVETVRYTPDAATAVPGTPYGM